MSDLQRNISQQDVPTPDQIAQRAYEIYQSRGGENGRDVEDWLAAESELRSKNAPKMPAPSLSSSTSNDRSRNSTTTPRQRQSKTRTPSSYETSNPVNPVDHQNSSF